MSAESAGAMAFAKWGHLFAGGLGIGAVIARRETMTKREMIFAASSGIIAILWGTPIAMFYAKGYMPAHPSNEILEAMNGLIGAIMGLGGFYFISGILVIADRFSKNPWWVIDRLRGVKGGNEE